MSAFSWKVNIYSLFIFHISMYGGPFKVCVTFFFRADFISDQIHKSQHRSYGCFQWFRLSSSENLYPLARFGRNSVTMTCPNCQSYILTERIYKVTIMCFCFKIYMRIYIIFSVSEKYNRKENLIGCNTSLLWSMEL